MQIPSVYAAVDTRKTPSGVYPRRHRKELDVCRWLIPSVYAAVDTRKTPSGVYRVTE
jgi:hypothetical protein